MARPLLIAPALAFLAPAFTGCLGGDTAPAAERLPVATSAEEAGASTGPSPSAPKQAYQVAASEGHAAQVAYPALMQTNPAKAPVSLDLSGEFKPTDCRGLNFGGLEELALRQVSDHRRRHALAEHLQVGDVFQYHIRLSYVNAADNWAEIHPMYAIGNTILSHEESTQEANGEVVVEWLGQSYRAAEEDPAFVEVGCWYGAFTEPIPYTFTVELTFADSAIPAETPIRVPVPPGATQMFVRGVAVDPEQGVLSHFRLFGPDDQLLCECALSSNQEVASIPLTQTGEHVLLVDHTGNGFVSVAFDVAPTEPLSAMLSEWVAISILASDGGALDQTVTLDLPQVPLFMHAFVLAGESPGGLGQRTTLHLQNARGEVLRMAWGGHLTFQNPLGEGHAWLGIPSTGEGAWDYAVDHHAFAPGEHQAHVKAEFLRGEVILLTRQYVR